jgi:hypothetical protein
MACRHRRSEWNSQSDYLWRALSSRVSTATPCEEIRKSVAFCFLEERKDTTMAKKTKKPVLFWDLDTDQFWELDSDQSQVVEVAHPTDPTKELFRREYPKPKKSAKKPHKSQK